MATDGSGSSRSTRRHRRPAPLAADRLLPAAARNPPFLLARPVRDRRAVRRVHQLVGDADHGPLAEGPARLPRRLHPLRDAALRLRVPGREPVPALLPRQRPERVSDRRPHRPARATEPLGDRLPPLPRASGLCSSAGMLSGGGSVSSGGRGLSVGGVMGLASILSWFSAHGSWPLAARPARLQRLGARLHGAVLRVPVPAHRPLPELAPARLPREAELEPPEAEGRPQVVSTDDLRRSRLSVFFRLLLAFPHIFWLLLWTILALPRRDRELVRHARHGPAGRDRSRASCRAYIRYSAHVSAFLYVIGEPVPGLRRRPRELSGRRADRPTRRARTAGSPGSSSCSPLPALLLSSAFGWALFVAAMLIWFSSLVRGRAPSGLQTHGRLRDRLRRAGERLPLRAHRPLPALEPARRRRARMRLAGLLGSSPPCMLALRRRLRRRS